MLRFWLLACHLTQVLQLPIHGQNKKNYVIGGFDAVTYKSPMPYDMYQI